jgi:hypothetical protein
VSHEPPDQSHTWVPPHTRRCPASRTHQLQHVAPWQSCQTPTRQPCRPQQAPALHTTHRQQPCCGKTTVYDLCGALKPTMRYRGAQPASNSGAVTLKNTAYSPNPPTRPYPTWHLSQTGPAAPTRFNALQDHALARGWHTQLLPTILSAPSPRVAQSIATLKHPATTGTQ